MSAVLLVMYGILASMAGTQEMPLDSLALVIKDVAFLGLTGRWQLDGSWQTATPKAVHRHLTEASP